VVLHRLGQSNEIKFDRVTSKQEYNMLFDDVNGVRTAFLASLAVASAVFYHRSTGILWNKGPWPLCAPQIPGVPLQQGPLRVEAVGVMLELCFYGIAESCKRDMGAAAPTTFEC